jgi:16S rRNA (cytosine967-C5)-methyltransferase
MSAHSRQSPGSGRAAASSRALAARVVATVLSGRSLAVALPPALTAVDPANRGQTQDLCYGTLRWMPRLVAILELLLRRPLASREREVRALALVGLYGLLYTRAPVYATVSETVAATRQLRGKSWASGLVNAVLRNFQRRRDQILTVVDANPEARLAHPTWLLERLQHDWPEDWEAVADANNQPPPMVLRVALDRCSRAQYLALLARRGISAQAHARVASAVVLGSPCEVTVLPGFDQGLVSVQDAAAQVAAWLLAPARGQRVLDACAAPGGKTGHLLELQPALEELVAVDNDQARLDRVEHNLCRLRRRATLMLGDTARPAGWWDGKRFDRILLDVPCSATGVIRRHPDIKVLRRADDSAGLAARQLELLRAAWTMLATGGKLVYATCSLLKMENCDLIDRFLADQAGARVDMPSTDWGRGSGAGRQILPGSDGMDGFFYVRLRKSASDPQ